MKSLSGILASVLLCGVAAGCRSVSDDRIPPMPVRIVFNTPGEWHVYGIAGATDTRTFILADRLPAGFPYTAVSATGFGGVLLAGQYTYAGDPVADAPMAYDLACPVEMRADVRIAADTEKLCARCPRCGSTYDIFQGLGAPLSGPAHEHGYGLRRYRVGPGAGGQYILVTN